MGTGMQPSSRNLPKRSESPPPLGCARTSLRRPSRSIWRPVRSKIRPRGVCRPQASETSNELRLELPIVAYTNDKETKDFLEREAQRLAPGLKRKSGVRYRLNRWREEQLTRGVKLTYKDLVTEYVRLNQTKEPFAQIPHGRYINFVSDFMAAEKGATRDQATRAWARLKTLDVPKTYRSWVTSHDAAAEPGVADGRDPRFRSPSRRITSPRTG